MAADLHIHAMGTGENAVTISDLQCFFSSTLGSKYFRLDGGMPNSCLSKPGSPHSQHDCPHHLKIAGGFVGEAKAENWVPGCDGIWIGEVSWLKAGLFEDGERYIPGPVEAVRELIGEELPVLDEELKAKILAACGVENTTAYDTIDVNQQSWRDEKPLPEWLDEHMGQQLFTVSW